MSSTFRKPAARLLVGAALALAAQAATAQNTWVRITTTQGPIDMKLLDTEAPLTVANFLGYVNRHDYTDVFVHRAEWKSPTVPFVIQSGGYKWPSGAGISAIATQPAVPNEFSPTRSNLKGTVAMAKLGTDPNSATSQWFVNMSDNTFLDSSNGGFTVFGRLTTSGMEVASRIASLPIIDMTPYGYPIFNEIPLQNWTGPVGSSIYRANFVLTTDSRVLASSTDYDRAFNYIEAMFPQYASPVNGEPGTYQQYHYRYYAGTNAYLGTDGTNVCYLVPAIDPDNIHCDLGTVQAWFDNAQAAGY